VSQLHLVELVVAYVAGLLTIPLMVIAVFMRARMIRPNTEGKS
jgi:hypothetical protein